MGSPDYDLVPSAVLYLHPEGLTREEFGKELQQIYYYPLVRIEEFLSDEEKRNLDWSGLEQKIGEKCYRALPLASIDSLFTVARALGLREKSSESKVKLFSFDKPLVFVNGEEAITYFGYIDQQWIGVSRLPVNVLAYQDTLFHGARPVSVDCSKLPHYYSQSIGSYLRVEENDLIFSGASLRDFLKETNISLPLPSGSHSDNLFIRIRPLDSFRLSKESHMIELFEVRFKNFLFESLDSFYQQFPLLHVDLRYDWSEDFGEFSREHVSKNHYFWRKTGDKYYFDPLSFDHLNAGSTGYTDLILTAEAIKHKAWKLFSWSALNFHFVSSFLEAFPDAKKSYDRAVFDSHYALFAKGRGLSHNDLLRIRATNPCLEDLAEPLL